MENRNKVTIYINLYTFISQFYNKYKNKSSKKLINSSDIKSCVGNVSRNNNIISNKVELILFNYFSNKTIEANLFLVLKQVHPDLDITNEAMKFLVDMYPNILHYILEIINTFEGKEGYLEYIVEDYFPDEIQKQIGGELGKHAASETMKSLTKYNATTVSQNIKRTYNDNELVYDLSYRSGLLFSVLNIIVFMTINEKFPKQFALNGKAQVNFAIGAASCIEYLFAEILELAGNSVRDKNKKFDEFMGLDEIISTKEKNEKINKNEVYDYSLLNLGENEGDEYYENTTILVDNIKDCLRSDDELEQFYIKVFKKSI